jgi:hypothetical protein
LVELIGTLLRHPLIKGKIDRTMEALKFRRGPSKATVHTSNLIRKMTVYGASVSGAAILPPVSGKPFSVIGVSCLRLILRPGTSRRL